MTQKEDIKNAVETMRKGGVILYPPTPYGELAATPPTPKP